jgi:hypothetical protein
MLGTGTGNSHLSLCWRWLLALCVCERESVCAHPKYLLLLLRPLSQSGASAMCTSFCPGLWLCLRASACLIYKLARAFCLIPYNKLNKSGTCRHLFHQSLRAHTQHTHTHTEAKRAQPFPPTFGPYEYYATPREGGRTAERTPPRSLLCRSN